MVDVFIGVGSSINKLENIQLGLASLTAVFGELSISPLYESEAVGFSGGNFYNLVIRLTSDLNVQAVIAQLKAIERKQGRPENASKFAPRALDLDLLLYGKYQNIELDLPRAEIIKNAFVLKPLADLAPLLTHPLLGDTYQTLWENYPKNKQKLWKI